MRKLCAWTTVAFLGACGAAAAQDGKETSSAATDTSGPVGAQLRVRFLLTRHRGEQKVSSRPYMLLFHAEEKATRVFIGSQVPLRANQNGVPTVVFKNVGVEAEASARLLSDGRYRVEARFEDSYVFDAGEAVHSPATAGADENPILRVLQSDAKLAIRDGETLPFASAVDPITGDLVRVDVTLNVVR